MRGGSMSYMKLLKLLYMVDRTALLRWGRPVTMDRFVSMRHGPVLSTVYDLITEEAPPNHSVVWAKYISAPQNWEVSLLSADFPADRLAPAEERLIDEIYTTYGYFRRWDLVQHLHEVLPEWKDPGESSRNIEVREILGADPDDECDAEHTERELFLLNKSNALLRAG